MPSRATHHTTQTTHTRTPHTPHTKLRQVALGLLKTFFCAFMMSTNPGVDSATAAARRRQRRLRSWLRHERMTVAMTLAEMTHHTAPRGPKMARVGEEVVHDAHEALRGQKTPPLGTQPAALREPRAAVGCGARGGVPPLPALGGDCSLDDVAVQFLVAQTLLEREQKALAVKEEEELVADLASKEQRLLDAVENLARSWDRSSPLSHVEAVAATWSRAKTDLAKKGITASPGRYTNTGRAAVLHDPGGASASSSSSVNAAVYYADWFCW